ncbi:lamin tail domain containing 1 [Cricetulus griseus]
MKGKQGGGGAPAAPRPRVLGLGGGSPLAAPGQAAPLLCLSQLKFPFQAPPALHSPAPGRTLALPCSVPAALPSVNCSGLLPYPGRPFWLSSRCTQGRSAGLLRPRSRGAREAQGASPGDVPCPACAQRPERKQLSLMMETKNTVKALTSDFEINKQETKMHLEETREEKLGNLTPAKQPSSVHFFPEIIDLEATPMQLSTSTSQNIPFNLPQVTNAQNSGLTLSSAGPLTSKSTLLSIPRGDASLSKQSSFLEDIKIAEVNVKGLFVRLMNSSTDKETEIGNHILQQNVNGQAVSLYRFPPNIIMHASSTVTMPLQPQGLRRLRHKELQLYPGKCKDTFLTFNDTEKPICAERLMTVTSVDLSWNPSGICQQQTAFSKVWAAASEAKPQPPTDFVWEEQIRFRSSPDCTTILCKPHGEAIAWYTPIHWKQAWEKLETDIEFDRCSVVIPTLKKRMFGQRTASMSSINKEKQEPAKEPSQCRIDHIYPALPKEKEILPSTLPTRSPWCCNPHTSPHPYCSLIEPHDPDTSEKRLDTQLKSRPAKLASAPDSSGFVFFLSTVLSGNEKSFAPDLHFIFVGRQCVAATRVIPTWVAYAATKTMVTSKYKLRLRATSGSMVLLQVGPVLTSMVYVAVGGHRNRAC